MIKVNLLFLNSIIIGSLILILEHIDKYSFFGYLNPQIELIFVFFIIYFSLFMYNFKKKPIGAQLLLTLIFFIFAHYLIATPEIFRISLILISFILIASLVIKNSNHTKQMLLLNIIKYCCFVNCIYGIFFNEVFVGNRVGGLDQAPVLFGYNMLLGFWLSMISYKTNMGSNKFNSKLDLLYAIGFIVGILLSQSRGSFFGLISGMTFIFFFSKKINYKYIIYISIVVTALSIFFIYNSPFFYKNFGLQRIIDIFTGNANEERFIIWRQMIDVYFKDLNIFRFLIGGGVGSGNDLIGRGVHSDHLKIIFDFGIIGYLIYLIKILNSFKLIDVFSVYLGGFLVSTLMSGIFYVNVGSITNSFSYFLVLIVLFNFIKLNNK